MLAYDNPFNRWVAGPGAAYFRDEAACAARFDAQFGDVVGLETMREVSRERHAALFIWDKVLAEYEALLLKWQN